jgi:hypothetical protein
MSEFHFIDKNAAYTEETRNPLSRIAPHSEKNGVIGFRKENYLASYFVTGL